LIFTETNLPGAYIIELRPSHDERGFFARSWCQREFAARGLKTEVRQCNISFNKQKGTLRGMHYQAKPHEEAKLVTCIRGAVHDVIIDLRSNSPTFKQWLGVELNHQDRRMLYIPEGFAHGFQTLEDNTEVFYYMFEFYHPESARGIRWDDPVFAITWPLDVAKLSPNDKSYKTNVN
jgi:dTDP-4-dehydrorhamnose 3,5-epimerase